MDLVLLRDVVRKRRIHWRQHAITRMMQRGIRRDDVMKVLLSGEVIEDYPDDRPFPSALLFDMIESRPLHVVVALSPASQYAYIITVYEPDPDRFGPDFRTRRPS